MEGLSKGFSETRDAKPFPARKGGLHRFRNRLGRKNRKITREAVSADEEASAIFAAELKVIGIWASSRFGASTVDLGMYILGMRRDYCRSGFTAPESQERKVLGLKLPLSCCGTSAMLCNLPGPLFFSLK